MGGRNTSILREGKGEEERRSVGEGTRATNHKGEVGVPGRRRKGRLIRDGDKGEEMRVLRVGVWGG